MIGDAPTSMPRNCSRRGNSGASSLRARRRCGSGAWLMPTSAASTKLEPAPRKELRARAAWNEQAFLARNLAVLGLIDLFTSDYPAAAETLGPLVRRMQEIGAGEPSGFPPRELAIEALIAVGDLDEARVQLEWLDEAGRRRATLWPLAMGARCRGLLQAAEGDLEAGARKLRASAEGA